MEIETKLRAGLAELDELSRYEYHENLDKVLSLDHGDQDVESALRVARLIGVVIKQPFAERVERNEPSFRTGAYREWLLIDEGSFKKQEGKMIWQARLLEELAQEMNFSSTYQLASYAHYESGFFECLAKSVRKHVCSDLPSGRKVKDAVARARSPLKHEATASRDVIAGTAGASIAAALMSAVPFLGIVGAPVIAGIVLILYKIGIDAFCEWVSTDNFRPNDSGPN